ncbi:MAG TPA: disulfide oxidoreductase [Acidimicrobiales bacterium]|nr:disulfide oxidoreductase [Acidimicrobiales bacterium]
MSVETANVFFSVLSLAAGALAVTVAIAAVVARRSPDGRAALLLDEIRPLALWGAFAVAATATLGSLYYSEVEGLVPCEYCWYQRIAMYPLAVILGIAAVRGDTSIRRYAIPVAAIGLAISAYHYQLEWFPDQSSSCSALVPCNVRYFEQFGFVSLAFMALTGFAAIIALLAVAEPATDQPADNDGGTHDRVPEELPA